MNLAPSEHPVTLRLQAEFGDAIVETHAHRGDHTVVVQPGKYLDLIRFLHDDPECSFDFLVDITAVDRLRMKLRPRFEVVLHFYSSRSNGRFRVKVRPSDDASPEIDSITEIYPAANWPEREVWDMFGVRFKGHPNLRRILLYEEFEGHPLRKDYPVNKRQPLVVERPVPQDRPATFFYT